MPRPSKFTRSDTKGRRSVVSGYKRVNAFLPDDVFRRLRLLAVECDTSMSEILTEAITAYRPKGRGRE